MAAEEHGMMEEYKEKLRASCELCHLDLDDWSVEDVNELILHVMKHGLSKSDSNAFGSAAGLFRELVCYGSQPEDIQIRFSKSRKAGEQQAIVEQMENAINHPVFRIRWNSLSMLARSGSVDSVEKMIEFLIERSKTTPRSCRGWFQKLVGSAGLNQQATGMTASMRVCLSDWCDPVRI